MTFRVTLGTSCWKMANQQNGRSLGPWNTKWKRAAPAGTPPLDWYVSKKLFLLSFTVIWRFVTEARVTLCNTVSHEEFICKPLRAPTSCGASWNMLIPGAHCPVSVVNATLSMCHNHWSPKLKLHAQQRRPSAAKNKLKKKDFTAYTWQSWNLKAGSDSIISAPIHSVHHNFLL